MAVENKMIPIRVKLKASSIALATGAGLFLVAGFAIKLLKFVVIEYLPLNVPNQVFAYTFAALVAVTFAYTLNSYKRKLARWQQENAPNSPPA